MYCMHARIAYSNIHVYFVKLCCTFWKVCQAQKQTTKKSLSNRKVLIFGNIYKFSSSWVNQGRLDYNMYK
jgi:hypothetical protein